MTDSPACPACGKTFHRDDVRCSACGAPRPEADFAPPAPGGATWVISAPADEGEGKETPPPAAIETDGWQEVRKQLEEATRGEFEVQRELGRGGMAAVYLARDLALGRSVAIKVMAPGLLMGSGMVDRFRQEAVTVANLHHPNIVTIHTVRQAGHLHFFVMQVVEGCSLETLLAGPASLPVSLIQVILFQVGTGLSYAHRHGVIHRDIKPANVLLDGEGNSILTDFGIAKVTTATNLTQTGSTIGTPSYMSPEQARAGELSSASDQYSLGVVAYEMLTGKPPFTGGAFEIMQAHNSVTPPAIRERRPDCPPELEAAVLRMLAKDPEERFPSVAEAIEAIGGYIPGPRDPIRRELARIAESGTSSVPPGSTPPGPIPLGETLPAPVEALSPPPTPESPASPPPESPASPRRRARPRWARPPVLVGGAVASALIATVAVVSFQRSPPAENEPTAPAALPLNAISFPSAPEFLLVGGTVRVRAILQNTEGLAVTDEPIAWSSDDTTIATVEGFGEEVAVAGLAPGSATIQASAAGVVGTFTLLVSEPASGQLTVSTPRREVLIDQEITLSAELIDQTGAPVPDATISWNSSDPGVVEVDPETGVATGRSLGSARLTAGSGEQTGSVGLRVLGLVEAITVNPPAGPLEVGGTAVLRTSVISRPAGYLGREGMSWSSSDSSVAAVSFSEADSVVLTLLGEGEAILTARVDAVQGSVTFRVESPPPEVTLSLSPASISVEAVEEGSPPPDRSVEVRVTGDAAPSVGVVEYGGGSGGWLRQSLGMSPEGGTLLMVGAEVRGLVPGIYTASVPVRAGNQTRLLEVQLVVAPDPGRGAVEPTEAAAREISTLLDGYLGALNTKDIGRVRELFPSLSQDATDELLRLPDTDQYYIALQPGSLRIGVREGTLDGDVMSGVLGPDGQGELRRVVYTFGRGDQGWFIVSFRVGG